MVELENALNVGVMEQFEMPSLSSKLSLDIYYKHIKYGVRCSYCNTKWPCDAVQAAKEGDSVRIDLQVAKNEIQRLKIKLIEATP